MYNITSVLQKARSVKGLTQKQVADQVGITVRRYQRYEYNERNLSLEMAAKIAKILEISLYDLVPDSSRKNYFRKERI
ncbi:helix-turn-helix domain-containing protein [Sulfoacidibacillus thermotolerans]|uniref:HTH cro/C1-type domain-containing protein n=1 Tax=Sulfoacidibacillus thermotolerans TaxID=1765684 RepID=A0A2U3CVR4_SULT2|nr:helix-turn-helix transcriptional regulator [Sulfoacidibacillus thermotolerans]PWI53143.1 hypothetical protein BM613_13990 [Sulfoacidibacillus thermotolerans]